MQFKDMLKNTKFARMECSFVGNPDFILLGRLKKGYRSTISQI